MSQLLQSVLTSKLEAASLNDGKERSELGDDWEEVHTSDEEIVGESQKRRETKTRRDEDSFLTIATSLDPFLLTIDVATAPPTAPGTPAELSRPTSPNAPGHAPKLRSNLSFAGERPVRVKAVKSKTDPLRSLPKNVSQRIFLSLRTRDLLSLSAVCRRYSKSQTLNYCWYRQVLSQFDSQDAGSNSSYNSPAMTPNPSSSSSTAGAHWTRRESRTNWKQEYIKKKRLAEREYARENNLFSGSSSGYTTPSRSQRLADSGVKTASTVREEQWKEDAEKEQVGYSKNEMREYYKEMGGSKGGKGKGVKAKSGKGGTRAADEGLWE